MALSIVDEECCAQGEIIWGDVEVPLQERAQLFEKHWVGERRLRNVRGVPLGLRVYNYRNPKRAPLERFRGFRASG